MLKKNKKIKNVKFIIIISCDLTVYYFKSAFKLSKLKRIKAINATTRLL